MTTATIISIAINVVLILAGILSWFKVPDMLVEHYKSKLAETNQQKENEFKQEMQKQQQNFESNLQKTLAEQEREFEQKSDLLKKRREIIPIVYTKLLELNGVVRQNEHSKKQPIQVNVNNYIEAQRLFLTESVYNDIKNVQKLMNQISTSYESPQQGSKAQYQHETLVKIEKQLKQSLSELEETFTKIMFGKRIEK